MKARLVLLVGLPLALLLAAWMGPRLLDWEAQRDRVAAMASARLGRPVAVGGPLRVTLLPHPMVEAAQVLVGEPEGGDLGVTARAMRLRVGLWPLLLGRIEPRDLTLVGADIRLPWPPASIAALRPPPWLTGFDARIENSRIAVGAAVLEGVDARLAAPGPLDAVRAEGSFSWRGAPVRFEAVIGRPGFDGAATLDVVLALAGASATARGILVAEGGFEGRMEASGPDLAAVIAAPAGPFRAAGRLAVTALVAAADDLALDLAGVTGRGAATFRFTPEPLLELAIALARIDLDAWIATLRAAAPPPVPVGLDLSAEVASFRGQTLRRLRGGVFRQGDQVTLTDISVLLPGEAQIEAAGATAGSRLELGLRFSGPSLRTSLAAFGVDVERFDPARLRAFDGHARLVMEATQIGVPELAARVDGARFSGAGVLRFGARPALGLGLTFDRLDLETLLPRLPSWAEVSAAAGGFDANLRLAAETASWRGVRAERATLDAVLEGGRFGLRRLSARIGEADIALAGSVVLGPALRFGEIGLDVAAGSAAGLTRAVPSLPALPEGLAAAPLRLRMTGGGLAEALALTAEGELGELRVEGQASLNLPQGQATGSLTLRHPGAARLALLLGAREPPAWLGEGSFSLIAALAAGPAGLGAENFELVAGGLRARGQVALAVDGARPRVSGRVNAERLPLPGLPARGDEPLDLDALSRLDLDIALEAAEVASPDLPMLHEVNLRLGLDGGRLVLDGLRARLGGGTLEGGLALDAAAQPPRFSASLGLSGATLSGPLFGTPIDIAAGQVEGQGRFAAHGHAPSALLATLAGEGRLGLSGGVLAGVAMGAVAGAAGLEDAAAAEEGVRAGLDGGATAIDRLEGGWHAAGGIVVFDDVRIAAEGGATGAIEGSVDLLRGSLDLRFVVRPSAAEAPPIALRVTGPAQTPRRQPEVAPWARWRAAQ